MKKTIIFLIGILTVILLPTKVYAENIYGDNYINNVYLQRKDLSSGLIYFSHAQFLKKASNNELVYCIEPETIFENSGGYFQTNNPPQLTEEQILDMTLLSHFGYGYQNHTDDKWYGITQLLIWEVANKNYSYFITQTSNPKDTHLYTQELEELRTLVNDYKKETSLNNKTYTIVSGENFKVTDASLKHYTTKSKSIIQNDTLLIEKPTLGTHTITLEKSHNLYNKHSLFYTNSTNQDVMDIGDPSPIYETFTLKVIETSAKISKVDAETNNTTPQGDASLIGATFDLLDNNDNIIDEIVFTEPVLYLKKLPFGRYCLKETKAGVGYHKVGGKYCFTLTEQHPNIITGIGNRVIKGTLKIKKQYGIENNFIPEANISFNIYHKDQLLKTIITNEQGIAEITLPYGTYKVVQLTTTEGYQKVEPTIISITNENTITLNLKDYKIEVPDTSTKSFFHKIISYIINILCGKK